MKTLLQFILKRYTFRKQLSKLLFVLLLTVPGMSVNAQETCDVDFSWEVDAANPLLVHFCGGGFFVHGSFSYSCLWEFGDGGVSNDSCPNYTYAQAGTYFVCQHAAMCVGGGLSCHDSICKYITVGQSATAINEAGVDNVFGINYFPVSKNLVVRINQSAQFRLIDALGRVEREIYLIKGENSIDLSNLKNGLYFYSATQSGKNISMGKVVVN